MFLIDSPFHCNDFCLSHVASSKDTRPSATLPSVGIRQISFRRAPQSKVITGRADEKQSKRIHKQFHLNCIFCGDWRCWKRDQTCRCRYKRNLSEEGSPIHCGTERWRSQCRIATCPNCLEGKHWSNGENEEELWCAWEIHDSLTVGCRKQSSILVVEALPRRLNEKCRRRIHQSSPTLLKSWITWSSIEISYFWVSFIR